MYRNLEAELARVGMTRQELAKKLGCTPATLSMKLKGKSPLSLFEAAAIKTIVGVNIPIEELFALDNQDAS